MALGRRDPCILTVIGCEGDDRGASLRHLLCVSQFVAVHLKYKEDNLVNTAPYSTASTILA